jgi:hypothetical protein
VIGSPDAARGEVVKAYVVVAPGVVPSDELAGELRSFVRERLSAYEYPRAVAFVDDLPLTVTGKIRRGELRRLDREQAARMSLMPSRELGERWPSLIPVGGHPAVDMPQHVVDATARAAERAPYAPTRGLLALREAIAAEHGVDPDPER